LLLVSVHILLWLALTVLGCSRKLLMLLHALLCHRLGRLMSSILLALVWSGSTKELTQLLLDLMLDLQLLLPVLFVLSVSLDCWAHLLLLLIDRLLLLGKIDLWRTWVVTMMLLWDCGWLIVGSMLWALWQSVAEPSKQLLLLLKDLSLSMLLEEAVDAVE